MRILIQACAPWTHTGYSTQARHMAQGFRELGHEVGWFAFWGLQGSMLQTKEYPIYPPAFNAWGADIVRGHKEHFKADIVLTHWDIWVVTEEYAKEAYPWVPYFPIDQYPAPPRAVARAKECYQPIVYSKFALQAMADAGVECAYAPHGVALNVFRPKDKLASRQTIGVPEDCFLIGMIAANKGYPSRKAFPEALLAFQEFRRRHEDAVLYLHTIMGTDNGGVDIRAIIESLDLPKGSVTSVDQYHYIIGLPDEYLADAYNAMSVLHSASLGEGFGLPVLEAQACGTRVVTTDCSAMTENTFDGIATKPAQRFWTQLNSWAAMPSVENILDAWERIYAGELGDWHEHSQKAIAGAQAFAWPVVMSQYWEPFLIELEARLKAGRRQIANLHTDFVTPDVSGGESHEAEHPCPGGEHRWSETGLWVGDTLRAPCLHQGCEAEMCVLKSGLHGVHATGFGMTRHGIALDIEDHPTGGVAKIVYRELQSSYRLDEIDFEDGDVVLDIGAHVGVVSVYLATLYPSIDIIAFEPIPENYTRLLRNIEANGAENVQAVCAAVSVGGGPLTLWAVMDQNSGGASAMLPGAGNQHVAPSLTLPEIFDQYVPGRCKLLKMDVEGMEHEVLTADNDLLKRVDYLAIEIHESELLELHGHTAEGLKNLCASYITGDQLRVCMSRLTGGDGRGDGADGDNVR